MAALTRSTRKRALSFAKASSVSVTTTEKAVETTKTATATTTSTTTTRTSTRIAKTAFKVPPTKPSSSTPKSTSAAPVGSPKSQSRTKLHPPPQLQSTSWVSIQVPRSELDLTTTLKCGQSFRWQREHEELPSGEISAPTWSCVLDHRIWFIQETEDGFRFRTVRPSSYPSSSTLLTTSTAGAAVTWKETGKDEQEELEKADRAFMRDYFQLDVPLTELYSKWSATDKNFKAKAPFFPGVRMLRQDPVENLFCFICSSNNNISRITQMASKMCSEYGAPLIIPPSKEDLGTDTSSSPSRVFYEFPTIEALAQDGVEETLRQLGFGYRAKYIATTARMIRDMKNGEEWLHGLRKVAYEDAHAALLTLQGVGPKVADCVCLMSLDKHETIPVDTHVWQIAMRDYRFRFEGKALPKAITPAIYKAVGRHFVDLFGGYAGWAHSVLFAADLRSIEGRVKEDPDVVKVEAEEGDEKVDSLVLKVEVTEEEEVEETVVKVEEHIKEIKLEDSVAGSSLSTGRRSSKRRKAV
ncbi:8-oxoguanine glycosylase ogg1 [Linnemannia exigua]|uniref:N-glycosylase/DNA lyase n=1 Tax=Linnemannia exigua TaxID=604196 RepID=A0AAD4H3T2_9FUNG|nr:8-oxoguanine glycosylase ogg1 [Linnemannia exigua]